MLNALRYTRILENAGFTEEQSKAAVDCWMEFMSAEFATKGDLKELEYVTKSAVKDFEHFFNNRIDQVELKLGKRIDEVETKLDKRCDQLEQKIDYLAKDFASFKTNLETDLTLKLGGIMVVGIGFLAALIKL